MILYPPERFDLNEWFPIVTFLFAFAICLILPRRFSTSSIVVYVVFTVFLSQSVDSLIAVMPFDLYDVSDSASYEIMDVFIYYFNYPVMTYLYLYAYDKWRWKGLKLFLYLLSSSLICTFLEWIADLCHVYTYKGWKLHDSPGVYMATFILYIWIYHLTLPLNLRSKSNGSLR